ncbi:MAG: hypothetical protein ACRDLQ_00800 [Solirubrobacterales bacterium]
MSARESGSASGSTPLLPDEYDSLIERLRETANAMIPRNATVLVVSRGDDELLRIGPRRALHFPQDEFGRYAGYHPEDSDAAIAVLEDMRARGGEYLLLPSTSFWWLDYYEGLRDHLERNYPPIVSADDCMIFELAPVGVHAPASDADTDRVSAVTSSRRLAGPLDELLRALLPDDARIAVVAGSEGDLPSFGSCTAVRAPDTADVLPALLEEAGAGGAEFLVIPASAYDRVHGGRRPADAIGAWRLVTRQRHLGEIYERWSDGSEPEADSLEPAAPSSSPVNGEPRAASRGFWQRISNFFRND